MRRLSYPKRSSSYDRGSSSHSKRISKFLRASHSEYATKTLCQEDQVHSRTRRTGRVCTSGSISLSGAKMLIHSGYCIVRRGFRQIFTPESRLEPDPLPDRRDTNTRIHPGISGTRRSRRYYLDMFPTDSPAPSLPGVDKVGGKRLSRQSPAGDCGCSAFHWRCLARS